MPKLTYWIANCLVDSRAYNIRCRTKREVLAQLGPEPSEYRPEDFSRPHKVTVQYRDALDLVIECLGEGGALWEENE